MQTTRAIRVAGLLLLVITSPARANPTKDPISPARQGWFAGVWSKVLRPGAAGAAVGAPRLTLGETIARARDEFQLYRGHRLERFSDYFVVGRSRFDAKLAVSDNLKRVVEDEKLPHYYAEIGGREVLHVVIDLARGKETTRAVRAVMGRVGQQTIELNYKAATEKNRYGHVAVRLGGGALFDLTGTRGLAELPPVAAKILDTVRGSSDLSLARRRSLRRFMESRKDGGDGAGFFGMLYAASPEQIEGTEAIYRKRQSEMTAFSVGGGDGSKGVFSCAQFLTEDVPFFNERGIGRSIGAKSTASAGRASAALEAVIVYKMPSALAEQPAFP